MRHIRIPATSANIGSGFDCAGLALCVYNDIYFEADAELSVDGRRSGLGSNMIIQAYNMACESLGIEPPPLRIRQKNSVPAARGMGSSAVCAVAGGAMALLAAGRRLNRERILEFAARLEGHPDNAAPAVLGGAVICARTASGYVYRRIEPDEALAAVLMVPSFKLNTPRARAVLPKSVPLEDAVFNASRFGLLADALRTRDYSLLGLALEDRLQIPYRRGLVPEYDEVCAAALSCGAYGACLSGAGPTVIAFADAKDRALKDRLEKRLSALRGGWRVIYTKLDGDGLISY